MRPETAETIKAGWRDLYGKRDAIVVDNLEGRTDTVELRCVDGYTGRIDVARADDRFMCTCCNRAIKPSKYGKGDTEVRIDSCHKIWCTSCWRKCLEWTVRSVKKHPDETRPRHIHPGGNYYQLLKESI